jgi:hypothetical protein
MRSVLAAAFMLCAGAAAAAAPVARWECSSSGAGAISPALANAARDYLSRVEALYPSQVLGLVRAGERYYLLNSRDMEWGDRTRLYLLAQRLYDVGGSAAPRGTSSSQGNPPVTEHEFPSQRYRRETTVLAPERQVLGVAPGGSPPPGSFVCLAAARAGREGLTRTPSGEVVLAAGRSVHLVDPREPQVAVEVRAGRDQPLSLGEIFHRSTRSGIYAGLTGGSAGQPGGAATIERPDGTLVFSTASAGGSVVETRVAPRSAPLPEEQPAVMAAQAPLPPPAVPGKVAAPPEKVVLPDERMKAVAAAANLVAVAPPMPLSAPPAPAPAVPDAPAIAARAAPAVLPSTAVAAQPAPTGAAPAAYDDYAKAMKTLMALKRSRSVMSVSESTYVHPAVEVFRRQHP